MTVAKLLSCQFLSTILYRILPGKMEFHNIKSSAALIYDEFFQNSGEFLVLIKIFNVYQFSDVDIASLCIFWQTFGQKIGSLCPLQSHQR